MLYLIDNDCEEIHHEIKDSDELGRRIREDPPTNWDELSQRFQNE